MTDQIQSEPRPNYKKAIDRRPWKVGFEASRQLKELASKWISERQGIVVYQNMLMDSSYFGDTSFMPARFIAEEDNQMHWAPLEHRPYGGLPSRRQQQVDFIELEDYAPEKGKTPVEVVIARAFTFETEPPQAKPGREKG